MKKNKKLKVIFTIVVIIGLLSIFTLSAFAENDTNIDTKGIDKLAEIFAGVFEKIAYLVILAGAMQFAWATKSDNPELRGQALKTIASGIFVIAVAKSYTIFMS